MENLSVAYSGTVYKADKPSSLESECIYGRGTYYTTSPERASHHEPANTFTVTLERAYPCTSRDVNRLMGHLRSKATSQGVPRDDLDAMTARWLSKTLEASGHDGIVVQGFDWDDVIVFQVDKSIRPKDNPPQDRSVA